MTAIEFQSAHSGELQQVLQSPMGKDLLVVLHSLRPPYESPVHEHLFIANREKVVGYELCLRNVLGLANPPKIVSQPEANYGVPDKKQE